MRESGWLRDTRTLVDGGTFCISCATHLRLVRWTAACTFCDNHVDTEEQAESDGWGYLADELGILRPFCIGCLKRLAAAERD